MSSERRSAVTTTCSVAALAPGLTDAVCAAAGAQNQIGSVTAQAEPNKRRHERDEILDMMRPLKYGRSHAPTSPSCTGPWRHTTPATRGCRPRLDSVLLHFYSEAAIKAWTHAHDNHAWMCCGLSRAGI